MKNIPRIFIGDDVKSGMIIPAPHDIAHYLARVMRTRDAIVFGGGHEYVAKLDDNARNIVIGVDTGHADPTGDITLYFAPIKRTDDLVNMVTQMGVKKIVPVITEHTVAQHINWDRIKKIAIEAAEQSNRNSVPEIAQPIKFADLPFADLIFSDERAAYGRDIKTEYKNAKNILVGPEGGFSDAEFATLDARGAKPLSLGPTILRAELAAPIAISRVTK